MNWWQNVFNQKNKYNRVKTTGQMNAGHVARKSVWPVVVAPVTGQLKKMDGDSEKGHSKNGFMMLPDGNNIMSPVSGIVMTSDEHTVTIQSMHHDKVTVQLHARNEILQGTRLATYGTGQQLHAGDLIGTTHAMGQDDVRVYVLFEDTVVPHVNYGAVYAGQSIWQYQEGTDAT
ncbi:PTS sugar transporter subunit IIA [uncultured Leuconostoc sp.]|uniref:PTS sugar transporter subunit IIA n=1 Tax=uncultured Leuconostoc sp. TaxID=173262 RepID=UPI0025EB4F47|nr:PTS sugar transporter subunit IIA [uncultured Leuconostoc sp.]